MSSVYYSEYDLHRYESSVVKRSGTISTTYDRKGADSRTDIAINDVVVFCIVMNPLHVGRIYKIATNSFGEKEYYAMVWGSDDDFGHNYKRGETAKLDPAMIAKVRSDTCGQCLKYKGGRGVCEGLEDLESFEVDKLLEVEQRILENKRKEDKVYITGHKCLKCAKFEDTYRVEQHIVLTTYNDELLLAAPGGYRRNPNDAYADAHYCVSTRSLGILKDGKLDRISFDYDTMTIAFGNTDIHRMCEDASRMKSIDADQLIQEAVDAKRHEFEAYIDGVVAKFPKGIKSKTAFAKEYRIKMPGKARLTYLRHKSKEDDCAYLWHRYSKEK